MCHVPLDVCGGPPRRFRDSREISLRVLASILVLSNMYPPHHYGGYELSCRDVVDRWRRTGHDVTVLTGTMRVAGVQDPSGERDQGVLRDLRIFYEAGKLVSPPLHQRIGIEKENQRTLRDTIERVKPKIISVWHMGAMSTGLLKALVESGIPLAYVVCDDWPTYAYKIDPWMKLWYKHGRIGSLVERLAGVPATLPDIGSSGVWLFISVNNRDRCLEWSPWAFSESTVTYNGIDHDDFPVAAATPDHPWRWRMANAGRLDPRKGLATAVHSLAYLPDEATLELLPSVDDPYRQELEAVARECGVSDRLRFTNVTRAELRGRYAQADVCVFPTEWDEPFGLVPVEAMACGVPVVATGSGGSGEFLIDDGNCLRIPQRDPQALATAVKRLADEPELRSRLVMSGFATARDLSVDRLAEVLEVWHLAAADRFANGRPAQRLLSIR